MRVIMVSYIKPAISGLGCANRFFSTNEYVNSLKEWSDSNACNNPSGWKKWADEDISVKIKVNPHPQKWLRWMVHLPTDVVAHLANSLEYLSNGRDALPILKASSDHADNSFSVRIPLAGKIVNLTHHQKISEEIFKLPRDDTRPDGFFSLAGENKNAMLMYMQRIFPDFNATAEDSIMTCSEEGSLKFRKIVHQFFLEKNFRQHKSDIDEIIEKRIDLWKNREQINLTQEAHALAAEIIGKVFLGNALAAEDSEKIALAVRLIMDAIGKGRYKNPKAQPSEEEKKAQRTLVDACKSLYQQEPSDNIVSLMKNEGYSEAQVGLMIFMLLLGGQETTASTIAYMLLKCAQMEDLQQDYINGEMPANFIVAEALRLAAPATGVARYVKQNLIIEITHSDGSIAQIPVYRGESLAPFPGFLARSEKIAGDEPDRFNPQRWQGKKINLNTPLWGGYGKGWHQCPGRELANYEILKVLDYALGNYVLQTPLVGEPEFCLAFTTKMKEDAIISAKPRNG